MDTARKAFHVSLFILIISFCAASPTIDDDVPDPSQNIFRRTDAEIGELAIKMKLSFLLDMGYSIFVSRDSNGDSAIIINPKYGNISHLPISDEMAQYVEDFLIDRDEEAYEDAILSDSMSFIENNLLIDKEGKWKLKLNNLDEELDVSDLINEKIRLGQQATFIIKSSNSSELYYRWDSVRQNKLPFNEEI
jgi:hypothetical protein